MTNENAWKRINGADFPGVWVSYKKHSNSYEEDFCDLMEHEVHGAELSHMPSREWKAVLDAVQGFDLKLALLRRWGFRGLALPRHIIRSGKLW